MKLIFTGYKWRPMSEGELEIINLERVLAEKPDQPDAGDIVEVE